MPIVKKLKIVGKKYDHTLKIDADGATERRIPNTTPSMGVGV